MHCHSMHYQHLVFIDRVVMCTRHISVIELLEDILKEDPGSF